MVPVHNLKYWSGFWALSTTTSKRKSRTAGSTCTTWVLNLTAFVNWVRHLTFSFVGTWADNTDLLSIIFWISSSTPFALSQLTLSVSLAPSPVDKDHSRWLLTSNRFDVSNHWYIFFRSSKSLLYWDDPSSTGSSPFCLEVLVTSCITCSTSPQQCKVDTQKPLVVSFIPCPFVSPPIDLTDNIVVCSITRSIHNPAWALSVHRTKW